MRTGTCQKGWQPQLVATEVWQIASDNILNSEAVDIVLICMLWVWQWQCLRKTVTVTSLSKSSQVVLHSYVIMMYGFALSLGWSCLHAPPPQAHPYSMAFTLDGMQDKHVNGEWDWEGLIPTFRTETSSTGHDSESIYESFHCVAVLRMHIKM